MFQIERIRAKEFSIRLDSSYLLRKLKEQLTWILEIVMMTHKYLHLVNSTKKFHGNPLL